MTHAVSKLGTLVVVCAFAVVACDDRVDGDGIETVTPSIILGDQVTEDAYGTTYFNVHTACTGTLISDRWVLTAKHCISGTPGGMRHSIINVPGTVTAEFFSPHPLVDVALVRLSASINNPATGVTFFNPLYLGSATDLQPGMTLYCQGWGRRSFNAQVSTLHGGFINVFAATPSTITMVPGPSGQIQWMGDSGSPCWVLKDGFPRVVGVTSTCTPNEANNAVDYCTLISVDNIRAWANATMGNAAAVFNAPTFNDNFPQMLLPGGPLGNGKYDVQMLTVGDNVISSLIAPLTWPVTPYLNANFGAAQTPRTGFVAQLPTGVNNAISSIKASGGVDLFAHIDLSTRVAQLTSGGRYVLLGGADNAVSSLVVPAGWGVTLYSNPDFTGESVRFPEGTFRWVGAFNDLASSIQVDEPAGMYIDWNYGGANARFLTGCYQMSELGGLPNDSISSVYVPPGTSVTLFADDGFSGATLTLTSSQSALTGFWNDVVSSFCVTRNFI